MPSIEERGAEVIDRLAAQARGTGSTISWASDIDRLYTRGGLPRGSSTGWRSVDELYTVGLRQWTLVTGVPGMGKSEFVDALSVNLCMSGRWHFAIYSPENHPVATHAAKLMEKYVGKPFTMGPNDRMTELEKEDAKCWVQEHYTFIDSELCTLPDLVRTGARVGRREGKRLGIVIDPWNTLNHYDASVRPVGISTTEYVSHVLSELTRFLKSDEGAWVHVWLVVHPTKLYRQQDGKFPIPTAYDVEGSAHWFNKADNILVVHREKNTETQEVQVILQKVRFKHIGRFGDTTLLYDKVSGVYFDPPPNRSPGLLLRAPARAVPI